MGLTSIGLAIIPFSSDHLVLTKATADILEHWHHHNEIRQSGKKQEQSDDQTSCKPTHSKIIDASVFRRKTKSEHKKKINTNVA